MVPMYSITAWCALVCKLTDLNGVLDFIRKLYECIGIFAFTQLVVAQLGGVAQTARRLTDEDCVHLPPIRWVFDKYSWTPGARFVQRSLTAVLQYVAVTLPLVLLGVIVSLVRHFTEHHDGPSRIQPLINGFFGMLIGASQLVAMYGLVVFYHANREGLDRMRPVQKLLSIKLLVFFTIWQGTGIHFLSKQFHIFDGLAHTLNLHGEEWRPEQLADAFVNALIVGEMFVLSIFHHAVYPPGEALMLQFGSVITSSPSGLPSAQPSPSRTRSNLAAQAVQPPSGAATPSCSRRQSNLTRGTASFDTCPTEGQATLSLCEGCDALREPPSSAAAATPAESDTAAADARLPLEPRTTWFGSDNWGRHVEGDQTRLEGCCHAGWSMARRFANVMNLSDVPAFYRDLRRHHRTGSTEFLRNNHTCANFARYALNFFRGRGDHNVGAAGAADSPLAR